MDCSWQDEGIMDKIREWVCQTNNVNFLWTVVKVSFLFKLCQSQMSRRKQEKKHSSNDGITDKNLNCAEAQKRESTAIITYSK